MDQREKWCKFSPSVPLSSFLTFFLSGSTAVFVATRPSLGASRLFHDLTRLRQMLATSSFFVSLRRELTVRPILVLWRTLRSMGWVCRERRWSSTSSEPEQFSFTSASSLFEIVCTASCAVIFSAYQFCLQKKNTMTQHKHENMEKNIELNKRRRGRKTNQSTDRSKASSLTQNNIKSINQSTAAIAVAHFLEKFDTFWNVP